MLSLDIESRRSLSKAGAACLIDEKEKELANELDENLYRIQQIIA